MNIAFYRRQNNRPLALAPAARGFDCLAHLVKGCARCSRCVHQLRQEDALRLIIAAHSVKRWNQMVFNQCERLHVLEHLTGKLRSFRL